MIERRPLVNDLYTADPSGIFASYQSGNDFRNVLLLITDV